MAEPSGVKRDIEEQEGEAAKRARFSGEGEGEDPHVSAAPVNVVEPSDTRICFPFLNSGSCKFGDTCKYRHLAQDHPDAIADKERQMNRRNAQTVPTSNQGFMGGQGVRDSGPICFPFLNKGSCDKENCRFRHLTPDHPDAVADAMRQGRYDKIPSHVNPMVDQNPNAKQNETRICFTFLNKGSCDKESCGFRHLLAGHPDAVADRMKRGQAPGAMGMGMPMQQPMMMQQPMQQPMMMQQPMQPYAAPLQPPPYGAPQIQQPYGAPQFQQQFQQPPPAYGGQHTAAYPQAEPEAGVIPTSAAPGETRICFPFLNRGSCDRDSGCRFRHLTADHPEAIADRLKKGGGEQPFASFAAPVQAPQQQLQSYGAPQLQQSYGAQQPQPYAAHQPAAYPQAEPEAGVIPTAAAPGETRICFPFLNRGSCDRDSGCRFRHLTADHPEAVADRLKKGGGEQPFASFAAPVQAPQQQ